MRRQILTVFSAVTIVSLLFPAIAFADDYTWSDNHDGTCTVTGYTGPGGDVTIPDTLGGLTVTAIGIRAFWNSSSLTSIMIGNSITDIGVSAFDGCSGLTAIIVDVLNPAYSSIAGVLFNKTQTTIIKCPETKAGSYTIPDSVTDIWAMAFERCYGLTSVTIPDSVTSIGNYAFNSCTGLTSVTIPDSVTSIGSSAFYSCTGLTSVTIPDSVTTIGEWAFSACVSLTTITVDALNPAFSSIAGVLFNKTQTVIIQYPGGNAGTYTIPYSVTSIGNCAFSGCTGLTSITIPDSVTRIAGFSGCTGLTSITIPDSVTTIRAYAFYYCTGLTSITIPDSVTSGIGRGMFYNCTSLTSVTIGNNVTSIGIQVFYQCYSLTSVTIPDSVTTIEDSAFFRCYALNNITIPDSVTSIGGSAFDSCYALNNITIPDSVTSIGYGAFYNCWQLTDATIGNSVSSIGDIAFYGCWQLTSVYFKGDAPTLGVNVFASVDNATVYYISWTSGWGATYGGLPTVPWPVLMADIDVDGKVNFSDFTIFASAWQTTAVDAGYNSMCDLIDDDVINFDDLLVFCENWLETDTISNHVFEIEMSLSYDYGVGYGSSVPVDYQFDAWMRVDNAVVSGTIETPGGVVYPAEMEVDDDEKWLGIYGESASLDDLADFNDGVYIFTVTYANGESESTSILFALEDESPIPPVDQVLVATYPLHNATDVPLTIDVLLTPLSNPDWTYGLDWFPEGASSGLSGCIEDLPYTTTTAGPLNLSPDTLYEIELTVNHAIWSTNDDGIPYVVDKDSEVEITFTTVSAP